MQSWQLELGCKQPAWWGGQEERTSKRACVERWTDARTVCRHVWKDSLQGPAHIPILLHLSLFCSQFSKLPGLLLIDTCAPLCNHCPGTWQSHCSWDSAFLLQQSRIPPLLLCRFTNVTYCSAIQNLLASWFLPLPLLCIICVMGDCSLMFLEWLSWNQIAQNWQLLVAGRDVLVKWLVGFFCFSFFSFFKIG